MLIAALAVVAALAAGATGTWSPCGLSMIETLSRPHSGRGRPVALASSATLLVGALAGGVVTFAALAWAGRHLAASLGDPAAALAATAVGAAAALAELRGVRIVPQVRRQVPERWRRTMPLPLAGGLYGILLGLGFTTFVLTLGVWALALICLLVGSTALGFAVGLAFGLGRALPVVALVCAPERRRRPLVDTMTERASLLRAARRWDGLALGALAAALMAGALTGSAAGAPRAVLPDARDPTVGGLDLSYATSTGEVVTVAGSGAIGRAAADAIALGGGNRAVATGPLLRVWPMAADWTTAPPAASIGVAQVTGLAVSGGWVAWRAARIGGGDLVYASQLAAGLPPRVVAASAASVQLSRPALSGGLLVLAANSPSLSRILSIDLATGRRAVLRAPRLRQVRDPAVHGSRLLYVEEGYCRQRLLLGRLRDARRDRAVLAIGSLARRDAGFEPGRTAVGSAAGRCPGSPRRSRDAMGTTALSASAAYISLWRPAAAPPVASRVVSVPAAAARR